MDKRNTKQTLGIKLLCLLLSFILWLYVSNVQNSVRTYTLKDVPVKVLNTESLKSYGLALAPDQNFSVDLKLEGDVKYIYSVSKDQFALTADIGEYALKSGINNIPVNVINYPEQINIKNNSNLTIQVNLEKLVTKEVNTTSDVNVTFAQGAYKQKEQFASEKVSVSGPKSAVDRVETVALVGTLENVSSNTTKEFPFKPLDADGKVVHGVTLSKNTGVISIGVNNGKSVNIVANTVGNLPVGYKLINTTLSKQTAQIIGSDSKINNITSLKTEEIDLSNITSSTEKQVKIIVPDGVSLLGGESTVTVKFEVQKEENKETTNNNTNNNNDNNKISKTISIPVNYTGLDNSLELSNETKTISFKIEGNKTDVESLNDSNFSCNFDISKYKDEGTFDGSPKIEIINSASKVTISNVGGIKFTLSKKATAKDPSKDKESNKVT
ncbi:CdaR family protein [Clostridium baratii]|uniref:CdaR family protein n=1 Tax=Clostridium baratii TaxID=1561 RepID=UPI0030D135A0